MKTLAALITMAALMSFERQSDDWLALAIELQDKADRLDRTDRRFIARMVNALALDDAPDPTPAQQRWLLDIKRRLDSDAEQADGRKNPKRRGR
jgi:hypothetical protein